ncbi:MAG: tetratricopeptide repeat protein [Cyclobacteriaceae bacterium]|nr:tetratricopeptide repeat protein [Cyclobacteriaceae bacterium]
MPKVGFSVGDKSITKLGLFDTKAIADSSVNKVQSIFGRPPDFSAVEKSADEFIANNPMPKFPPTESKFSPDTFGMQLLKKIGGNNSVVFVMGEDPSNAGRSGDTVTEIEKPATNAKVSKEIKKKLPSVPVYFTDANDLHAKIQETFCDWLKEQGNSAPTAVVVGLMDSKFNADSSSDVSTPPATNTPENASSTESTSPTQHANKSKVVPPPVKLTPSTEPTVESQRAFDRAMTNIRSGELNQAAKELAFAVEKSPDYAYAYANLGLVQLNLGYKGRALDNINKAISLEAKNPVFTYYLAVYYSRTDEVDRGIDALELAIKLGFAQSDNLQIDALKLGSTSGDDLLNLKRNRNDYCRMLERNGKFLCK